MSATDELLKNAERYAADFDNAELTIPPSRPPAIISRISRSRSRPIAASPRSVSPLAVTELRGEVAEYRELDEERILVLVRWSGHGKTSGLELRQMGAMGANLFQVRGGKVARLVFYWDGSRALADLGLAP